MKEQVLKLIAKNMPYKEDREITETDNLFSDLGYDSISFIDLISDLEEVLGEEFDDLNVFFENLSDVERLCSHINDIKREKND